jgi:hypothetical protein
MSNMFLNIVSTFKGDGISSATRQLGLFGAQASSFGSTLGKVGATLAGFGLAAKAVEFTKTSIDSARDLERNMYSLNTVFGDMAPQMESFAKGAHEIGLSQKDAAKASVFLGSVLKQSGFGMEDVTEQSQKLVSLGVDLAATYGYDVQEALLGMTALFRGEYDPIEKFGVAMKQSEINAELTARQLDHLTGSERRNAEQVIRMELLYQRAADATGAFSGQSGNLFVEQKKLQAQFENMQATVGQQLLPVMGSLVEALVPLVDELTPRLTQMVRDSLPALQSFTDLIKDMSDESTNTGATVKFLADSFGQLFGFVAQNFGVLVQLAILFGTLTTAVTVLNAVMALTPFGQFAVAAGLAAGAVLLIYDAITKAPENFAAFREQLDGAENQMQDWQKNAFGFSNSILTIQSSFMPVVGVLKDISNNALIALGLLAEIQKVNKPNTKALMEMDRRHSGAPGVLRIPSFSSSSIAGLSTGGGKSKAQQAAEEAQRKEKALLDKRKAAFKSFNDSVKSLFSQIKDSIMSSFSLPDLGNSVNSITKNINKLLAQTRNFASNISKLSGMGLNSTLLQQVIAAGPQAGGRLAESLASGGIGFINQINSAFSEFGNIASGIAQTGTTSAFANRQTVNNYSVSVTGGVATSADVGRAVVNAIKDFEKQSGTAWRA